ncbi:MAG: hypothetical protein N2205_00205, partial [Candidatus Caldatribacterium sp.]|nr:hypothetical protein [Candidatus Caldatribacterium sp.]
MRTRMLGRILLLIFSALILGGCARVELAIQVSQDATIPRARIAVYVKDYTVFTQLKQAASAEYAKLPSEEREYVLLQARDDVSPYVVAWEWRFPNEEKAKAFTEQFLGKSARLYKEQDLVILEAHLKGEELESALQSLGAEKVKPFLGSITLTLKAYMPGEILSYVDGSLEKSTVWK